MLTLFVMRGEKDREGGTSKDHLKRTQYLMSRVIFSQFLVPTLSPLRHYSHVAHSLSSCSPWEWNVAIAFQAIKKNVDEPHSYEKGRGQQLDVKRAS